MIESFWDEEWKEMHFGEDKLRMRYGLSNYGRLVSFTDNMMEGKLLKGGIVGGYKVFRYKQFHKTPKGTKIRHKQYFVHKLVAEYFFDAPKADDQFVIHLDYKKTNNYHKNLKWATKEEMEAHQKKNPNVIRARENQKNNKPFKGHKLTATKVKLIKQLLADPNRKTRMKMIAKQFGISEMQLYRIKSGENWSHVTID